MANVLSITPNNFESEIQSSQGPVLLDFGADWCGPCKQLAPIVEGVAEKYSGRLKVGYVDIGESPTLAGQFQVMSVPTLLFFQDGQVVRQLVGARSQIELEDVIDEIFFPS